MAIDILCLLACILAFVKGYKKGLVMAVFSLVGIFIGLLLAMRLSAYVAGQLKTNTNIAAGWIPFIAFALVLVGTIILIRIGGGIIQKSMEWVMLGWVNKIGGILFYGIFYLLLLSTILFFLGHLKIIGTSTFESSKTYAFIQPIAPKLLNLAGKGIPFFQGMFDQLSAYFDQLNT